MLYGRRDLAGIHPKRAQEHPFASRLGRLARGATIEGNLNTDQEAGLRHCGNASRPEPAKELACRGNPWRIVAAEAQKLLARLANDLSDMIPKRAAKRALERLN
ncbi:MAG: hypothetical protein ACFCD0_14450 [Gemmataceae bacterium]